VVRTYERLIRTTIFLAGFPILPLTLAAYERAERLKKAKLNVDGDDLRIAAIALEAGAKVVSANLRDFQRVPGLEVEDWAQPAA
jgi:tRNA(fMet)-specific endonuclease VapC